MPPRALCHAFWWAAALLNQAHTAVTMSSTPSCSAPAPVDAWVSCTGEALAPNATDVLCTHTGTGDTWRGDWRERLPCGEGTYVYANTQLKVEGTICGSMHALKFDGEGSMEWPDRSRYDGDLKDSRFDGQGTFTWANGDRYAGAWRGGQRHGRGKLESWQKSLLQSTAIEGKVNSMVYEGEWENDLMHGNGTMEYYGLPEEKCSAGVDGAMTEETASKHGRTLRRFQGRFERGFPRNGELKTETEDFAQVHFDGLTPVSDFATWYWTPDETPDDESKAPGTRLVDLEARGEEFRAARYQCGISMPTLPPYVIGIQRVENDDRRVMHDLQLRHVKNKVMKRRPSTAWTHTMEGWGFHAPGSGVDKSSAGGGVHGVPPWQSIAEEGFMATLSGSDHGRVYGAGIYFARDLLLAHKYAADAAHRSQAHARAGGQKDADEQPLLVFLSRIVKGVYTVGAPGMNIPPLDPNGAKGEHFHSLVDNTTNPKIFVINDNTRAYPAYLIKYSREVEKTLPSRWSGMPAAGRGGPPSVAAGRGMYAQGVAGGPTAGRGGPRSMAAGGGMYAQGVAGGPTAGRGGPPSVAAGRGMYAQSVAAVPTAGRGGPPSVAAGRGMYAQGVAAVSAAGRGGPPSVAAGRGMYAQGVATVAAAGGGVAARAAGGNLATLQHGVDGSSGSKRRRASKAATDARVLAKPRWAKKRNAEQGVIVISDDEDGN